MEKISMNVIHQETDCFEERVYSWMQKAIGHMDISPESYASIKTILNTNIPIAIPADAVKGKLQRISQAIAEFKYHQCQCIRNIKTGTWNICLYSNSFEIKEIDLDIKKSTIDYIIVFFNGTVSRNIVQTPNTISELPT